VWRYTLLGRLAYDRRNWLCSNTKCSHSAYPTDWGLDVLERLHGHSQEFASMVVLLTTLMPNAKAMNVFEKYFGFVVSTTLARGRTMAIGNQMYAAEKQAAEYYWDLRTSDPEKLEPAPAELKKLKRCKRIYGMADDSKLGIQDGKPGAEAPTTVPRTQEDGGFRNVRAMLIFRQEDLAGVSKGPHEILKRRVVAHIGTLQEWY
jgi:hypothetical protein